MMRMICRDQVSHETHPRLLREFLGLAHGEVPHLTPSGHPGLAYLHPSSGIVVEVGIRDPSAFPAHLQGCPYPRAPNGVCVAPPHCNCYKGQCTGMCELGTNLVY